MLAREARGVQGLTEQSDFELIRHKTESRGRSGKQCQLERNWSYSLRDNTQRAGLPSAKKAILESGSVFQL